MTPIGLNDLKKAAETLPFLVGESGMAHGVNAPSGWMWCPTGDLEVKVLYGP